MPIPRMTTRRWMIVVAVVALIAGMAVAIQRRVTFYERLSNHHFRVFHETYPYSSHARDTLKRLRLARYHLDLWDKYRRAARYPWLPVSPDPPLPSE